MSLSPPTNPITPPHSPLVVPHINTSPNPLEPHATTTIQNLQTANISSSNPNPMCTNLNLITQAHSSSTCPAQSHTSTHFEDKVAFPADDNDTTQALLMKRATRVHKKPNWLKDFVLKKNKNFFFSSLNMLVLLTRLLGLICIFFPL